MSDLSKKLSDTKATEAALCANIGTVESQLSAIQSEADLIESKRADLRTARQDLLADGKSTAEVDGKLKALSGPFDKSDLQAGLTRKLSRLKAELTKAAEARKQAAKDLAEADLKASIANCRTAAQGLLAMMETFRACRRALLEIDGMSYKFEASTDQPFRAEMIDIGKSIGSI